MKKIFFILIVSLFFTGSKPAFAQTNTLPNQAQSPKEMILKGPIDRRVKIVLLSGKTIEGRMVTKYESYCIILMKPDKSPYLVNYSNIKEIRIYKEFFRRATLTAFNIIKAPVYFGFSLVEFAYWIAEDTFEQIFRRGRSN
jgi:hypothetical protein